MSNYNEFTHNHYVPEWYQRRFMKPGQGKYHCLDVQPEVCTENGHRYTRRALRRLGPRTCFAQDDLYTVDWGSVKNVEIEKHFFGRIDREGKKAVEYFTAYDHTSASGKDFRALMTYMSVQKLRTPKGLAWLSHEAKIGDRNLDLILLQEVQNIHCAIWTECIWQIADASASDTKLIVSDHPVTVYNRGCFPLSDYCRGYNDPDIRMVATHTYFPLSLDKVLILTNLSWVRDCYQSETKYRPNPNPFRDAIFNFMAIQVGRQLSEDEVRQINFITKRRAYRYVAAAEEDWLYPEQYLATENWRKLGGGFLFMPEPRGVHMGGEIFIGYDNGRSQAFSEYGHRPWQRGYKDEARSKRETLMLERLKAEWASLHGPKWQAYSHDFGNHSLREDSPEMHEHYLATAQRWRQKRRRA